MFVTRPETATPQTRAKLSAENLNVYYGSFRAIKDATLEMRQNCVTALIGPSGCGKSTFIRALNRMHDLTPG
ncbi:MAG: ATP-binding cassette domain-containing protein, partial [Candidatus Eremiobacteraeota bacterium]|nr:ATP-binding cassette domain-containing protein [Candidatus Eremiobacteraeota bacterium]